MSTSKKEHEVSRKLLGKILLAQMETNHISVIDLAKATAVSESTIHNLKAGKLLGLTALRQLLSSPLLAFAVSPENACKIMCWVVRESLKECNQYPEFQLVCFPEERLREILPSLPDYMKNMRNRLNLSKNKVEIHLGCSYYRQITLIENDCNGVGIGPICDLFNRYMNELPYSPDEEWSIFGTLIFRMLFPPITGYQLKFVGLRKM